MGSLWPLPFVPSPHPLCCISPALLPPLFMTLKLFLLLSSVPGSGGLCRGALGAVERVQLPVRGWQQGPQPPGHGAAPARRGSLS